LMIITVILLGRVWCMVCPVEPITSAASLVGLKRKLPSYLRNGWLVAIFYSLILIIGIQGFSIHRVPQRMAVYLLFLVGLSLAIGLVFDRRVFCNNFCPVNLLLKIYAYISTLEWRVRDKNICRDRCRDKNCVNLKYAHRWHGRSCPNELNAPGLKDNGDCTLCTHCLKACPYDNFKFSTRRIAADLRDLDILSGPEAYFVLPLCGFVIYEVFTEWRTSEALLLYLPNKFNQAVGLSGTWFQNPVKAILIYLLLPLVLIGLPYAWVRYKNQMKSLGLYFRAINLAYIPILASVHLVKGLQKITSRIPYYPLAFKDPRGVVTAKAILAGNLKLNMVVVHRIGAGLNFLFPALILAGGIGGLLLARRQSRKYNLGPAPVLGLLVYFLAFLVQVTLWRFS